MTCRNYYHVHLIALLVVLLAAPSLIEARLNAKLQQKVERDLQFDKKEPWHPKPTQPQPQDGSNPEIFETDDFPLPLCGGDCDEDSDCEGDLICFQRGGGGVPVPGCQGGEDDKTKTDYCISNATTTTSGSTSTTAPSIETSNPTFTKEEEVATSSPTDATNSPSVAATTSRPSISKTKPPSLAPTKAPALAPTKSPSLAPTKSSTTSNAATNITQQTVATTNTTQAPSLSEGDVSSESLIEAEALDGDESTLVPTFSPSLDMITTLQPTTLGDKLSLLIPPTKKPTPQPTIAQGTDWGPFQLQLHWTNRSCWQDICDEEEVKWCMQCEGHHCDEGDLLWVERCRKDLPYQQLFSFSYVKRLGENEWGHLQIQDSADAQPLCLQRLPAGNKEGYKLFPCNATNQHQWYKGQGFRPDRLSQQSDLPFEIHPHLTKKELEASDSSTTTSNNDEDTEAAAVSKTISTGKENPYRKCVTMPHHPRQYEEIYQTDCITAQKDRTALWEMIWPSKWVEGADTDDEAVAIAQEEFSFNEERYYELDAPRRNPRCSPDRKCGICQGHCRSDDECLGKLKCFERGRRNEYETPPGCYGDGVPQMDYCYADDGN